MDQFYELGGLRVDLQNDFTKGLLKFTSPDGTKFDNTDKNMTKPEAGVEAGQPEQLPPEEEEAPAVLGPDEPQGTGDFGMLLSWGRFFLWRRTCACGVAQCCWWQVLARGGPPHFGGPKFS